MLLVLGRRREVDTSIGTGWGYDKAVRSIHEVNCTGSCSHRLRASRLPAGGCAHPVHVLTLRSDPDHELGITVLHPHHVNGGGWITSGAVLRRDDEDRAVGVLGDLVGHRAHHQPGEAARAA